VTVRTPLNNLLFLNAVIGTTSHSVLKSAGRKVPLAVTVVPKTFQYEEPFLNIITDPPHISNHTCGLR
jgi:hypothetical protein